MPSTPDTLSSPEPEQPGTPTSALPAVSTAFSWKDLLVAGLILAAVALTYLPILHAGFIWDDDGHVTKPALQSTQGLVRIWTEPGASQQYYPVLHSAFWFEHRLWGDNPLPYHLLNVLLHGLNACLLGFLLRRLRVPGAWFAAALFALHPVCVESVAWISEQKNTLSLLFYLSAAHAYLAWRHRAGSLRWLLATGLFCAAILSKSVAATLPAALLVVVWWIHGRLDFRRDLRPLLPWFALGLAAGLMTVWMERSFIGAKGSDFGLGLADRLVLSGRIACFYAGKLAWPSNLCFIYPRWDISAGEALQWSWTVATVVFLAGLVILAWRRGLRGPLAIVLLFLGSLVPALGFINVYPFIFSYVADHFQYLASLPLFTAAGVALAWVGSRSHRFAATAACGLLVVVLGYLSFKEVPQYEDATTLYQTLLARNPQCWMAENNLGNGLVDSGHPEEAIPHFERACQLKPDYAEGLSNLGDALTRSGKPKEALVPLHRALELQPTFAEATSNLGVAQMALGQREEAVTLFKKAIELDPHYAIGLYNYGLSLASSGNPKESIPFFRRALDLKPDYPDAEVNLAIALHLQGQSAEAFSHFERAIELSPTNPIAHFSYARALAMQGRLQDAVAQYNEALALNPQDPDTHEHLAILLARLGQREDADYHAMVASQLRSRR